MKDLTVGSIPGHLMRIAVPIAVGMVFQTAYYLVDLYFVGRLGDEAIAGLGSAGNAATYVRIPSMRRVRGRRFYWLEKRQ